MPALHHPQTPSSGQIARRRMILASLCVITGGTSLWLAASVVRPGDWSPLLVMILILYAAQMPWQIIGFWNATIGFAISQFANSPLAKCCPPAARVADTPVETSTAILMCIRDEETDAVFLRLEALLGELAITGASMRFHLYLLSDTSGALIARAEEAAMVGLRARWQGRFGGLTYRRRLTNEGFKAGNIRDFCLVHGASHDFALVLDADSFMSGAKIVECVRIMQATPTLGILQCLTVGLPSLSPLARLFQFGMRLGMRSYTLGSAWWQADCGPYWGHNALIRLKPFADHCDLPKLPGKPPFGGDILSHDQIEAVLMRRAGYEVRVIPVEGGSYEENPPTLIEFVRRDLRWCLGNLQYFALLGLSGLKVTSRVQLLLAIWMFLASAFNVSFWSLLLIQALTHPDGDWIARGPAYALIGVMIFLALVQKVATALVVLLNPEERAGWGGGGRFLASFAAELLFSFLLTPIMQLSQTAAIIMLCFGRTIGWQAQSRSEHAIFWGVAGRRFWAHTLAGCAAGWALWSISLPTALWSLPVYGGLLAAIPLAVVTSSPELGAWMAKSRVLAIPEDLFPPQEIRALNLPALQPVLTSSATQAPKGADETVISPVEDA